MTVLVCWCVDVREFVEVLICWSVVCVVVVICCAVMTMRFDDCIDDCVGVVIDVVIDVLPVCVRLRGGLLKGDNGRGWRGGGGLARV
jgi:hypothetical protein